VYYVVGSSQKNANQRTSVTLVILVDRQSIQEAIRAVRIRASRSSTVLYDSKRLPGIQSMMHRSITFNPELSSPTQRILNQLLGAIYDSKRLTGIQSMMDRSITFNPELSSATQRILNQLSGVICDSKGLAGIQSMMRRSITFNPELSSATQQMLNRLTAAIYADPSDWLGFRRCTDP
jgi:hypothetical protein